MSFNQCFKTTELITKKELLARENGFFVFLKMNQELDKNHRQISASVELKNITAEDTIRDAKLLIFAYDKNDLVLIPEGRKTPELLCIWKSKLPPATSKYCNIAKTDYSNEITYLKVHSLSFSIDDGSRYLINSSDIQLISE